jgi:hypothetical protein
MNVSNTRTCVLSKHYTEIIQGGQIAGQQVVGTARTPITSM